MMLITENFDELRVTPVVYGAKPMDEASVAKL